MWVSAQVCTEMVTFPGEKKHIRKERGASQSRVLLGFHQRNTRKNTHGIVLISFLVAAGTCWQRRLKKGKACLSSQAEGAVHHGREDMVAVV